MAKGWANSYVHLSPYGIVLSAEQEAAFYDPEATRVEGVRVNFAGEVALRGSEVVTAEGGDVILGHLFLRSTRLSSERRLLQQLWPFRKPRPVKACEEQGISEEMTRKLIAGGILVPLEPEVAWRVRAEEGVKQFVFKTWGGLGDILMCSPIVKYIKHFAPELSMRVVANNRDEARLMEFNPYVDEVAILARPRRFQPMGGTMSFEPRYGLLSPGERWSQPVARHIGELIGVPIEDASPLLYVGPEENAVGLAMVRTCGPYIAIHRDARRQQKQWPLAHWTRLIRYLAPVPVVQVGSISTPPVTGTIDRRGLDILESCALIKHAAVFIGIDSAMQHVAAACHVPSVVLFGPTPPIVFGHLEGHNLRVGTCKCYRRSREWFVCDRGCMKEIGVEEVLAAVRALPGVDERMVQA